jgi:hypothetical protein
MRISAIVILFALGDACGIAPDAKNATCCQCAGYTGDQHACHWCPSPVGGCRYFGSAEYGCPGFVVKRSDCPESCPSMSVSPSGSVTSSASHNSLVSLSQTPTPVPIPPAPSMRPFSKKGVGYFGGSCDDFGSNGLSNISWFFDWCVLHWRTPRCSSYFECCTGDAGDTIRLAWCAMGVRRRSPTTMSWVWSMSHRSGASTPSRT